jgi:hypothetical protein
MRADPAGGRRLVKMLCVGLWWAAFLPAPFSNLIPLRLNDRNHIDLYFI